MDRQAAVRYRSADPTTTPGSTRFLGRTILKNYSSDLVCSICRAAHGTLYHVREMMFGMRDPFTYAQCGNCGCLQLIDVPADLGRYYPDGYYSFNNPRAGGIRGLLRLIRNRSALAGARGLGAVLERWCPYPSYGLRGWTEWRAPPPRCAHS